MAKETSGRDLGARDEMSTSAQPRAAPADVRMNDVNDLRLALARAVAARKIPDDAITAVAKKLSASKYPIRGIDVCIYGICIDYFFDSDQFVKALPELVRVKDARVYGIEAFPWGIPWPDIYRVRVQQEFNEIAAQTPRPVG